MKKIALKENGFSLIELVLVIALLGTILTLTTINLFRPFSKAKVEAVSTDVVSILKEAQNKAMNTDTGGEAQSDDYGVHFETDKYILFKGSSFDGNDPTNFVVDTPQNIAITPALPCPLPPGDCNNMVFERISGEVIGFSALNNTVCVRETSTNKEILLTVNLFGVVDEQEGC